MNFWLNYSMRNNGAKSPKAKRDDLEICVEDIFVGKCVARSRYLVDAIGVFLYMSNATITAIE
jgi:hypothetical protein